MGKKKVNPKYIPVSWSIADSQRLANEVTQKMVLRAWAIVLYTLGNRWDTTTDSMLDFWDRINNQSSKIRSYGEAEARLKVLERSTGIQFALIRLDDMQIHTRADVDRLHRKLKNNALNTMFALVADTLEKENMMDDETKRWFWTYIHDITDDIERNRLSIRDLLGVLEDEFSLCLVCRDGQVALERV